MSTLPAVTGGEILVQDYYRGADWQANRIKVYRSLGHPTDPQEGIKNRHCCKVSDEAAFCLIQRPYISKTLLLTGRISPGDHHNKMLRRPFA